MTREKELQKMIEDSNTEIKRSKIKIAKLILSLVIWFAVGSLCYQWYDFKFLAILLLAFWASNLSNTK